MWLRQSTSVVISFGPFLDKTDGVTLETGLVSAIDHATTGAMCSKNGGALTIRSQAVTASTYDARGCYRLTLSTTDTNTLGTLRVIFEEAATCLPVWQDFMVVPANVWDSMFGADLLQVDMTQILGTAVATPATAGLLDVNIKQISTDATAADNCELMFDGTGYAGGTTRLKADVDTIKTQAVTAAAGVTFPTSIASPTNITAGTITTVTNLTNAPTSGDLTATMKTSVQTAADAALVAQNLDHLVGTATAIPAIVAGTYIDQMMDDGTAAFDRTTDSLQAIRDTAPLGTAMRGTDSAALASVCTEARLAELDAANLPTDVANVKTDTVAILVDTGTTLDARIPVALVGGRMDSDIGAKTGNVALSTQEKADVNAEVLDVVNVDTIPELAQAIPPATPTMRQAVMLRYMESRNKLDIDATNKEVHNDAGVVIAKKALSDDGTTYSEAEMVAGP